MDVMGQTRSDEHWHQVLSDLADGRGDAEQAGAAAQAWAVQPALRRHWQALHLIGDTLRSEELAQQSQDSEALLARLRERLAQEPVPLRTRAATAWLAPLAVAASFVGVALLLPAIKHLPGERPLPDAVVLLADAPLPIGQTLSGNAPSFVQAAGLREAVLEDALMAEPAASSVTSARGPR